MATINSFSGKRRAVIHNVSPVAGNGRFATKAIAGQTMCISADIFTDGHDVLSAVVVVKKEGNKSGQDLTMHLKGNDRWEAGFIPPEPGLYQFRIFAWVDELHSWQEATEKKFLAGQDIVAELANGVQLVESALPRIAVKSRKQVKDWLTAARATVDNTEAYRLTMDKELQEIFFACRDKQALTIHPDTFYFFADRKKAEYSTWYELFPRSAGQGAGLHGTFADVRHLLPRIKRMGFDVLYLPPIHPIGTTKRKGKNNALTATVDDPGSPWAIGSKEGGHKAIHPQLGNLKDFKALVDDAARQGIDIALDIALQCSPDHPYVTQHPEWFRWRADGTVQYAENPPKKYEDILPFYFDCPEWEALWQELKSIFEFWIDKGIRIFRVDNPHTKPFSFWEWLIGDLKARYPDVLFLAEAFTRPRLMEMLAMAGFSQSYTYFTWKYTKEEWRDYLTELHSSELKHYFRPNFWPNTPDILTDELAGGGQRAHLIRLIMAATMSASYGIYGPVFELGEHTQMPGKEEYVNNEKYEIRHWNWEQTNKVTEVISLVNRIRREHPALQCNGNLAVGETTDPYLFLFTRLSPLNDELMIVVINFDSFNNRQGMVKLPQQVCSLIDADNYQVKDLLSGDVYWWNKTENYVALNPDDLPAHILILPLPLKQDQ